MLLVCRGSVTNQSTGQMVVVLIMVLEAKWMTSIKGLCFNHPWVGWFVVGLRKNNWVDFNGSWCDLVGVQDQLPRGHYFPEPKGASFHGFLCLANKAKYFDKKYGISGYQCSCQSMSFDSSYPLMCRPMQCWWAKNKKLRILLILCKTSIWWRYVVTW